MAWVSDGESKNTAGMKQLVNMRQNHELDDEDVPFLHSIPELVHINKLFFGTLLDYYPLLHGTRASISFARALLEDGDEQVRELARAVLPLTAVVAKDRHNPNNVLRVSAEPFVTLLRSIGTVKQTVVPEVHRQWDGNRVGVVESPVAVAQGPPGSFLILDPRR